MVKFGTKVSHVQMMHDFDTSKLLISLVMPVREHENSGVADAVGSRSGKKLSVVDILGHRGGANHLQNQHSGYPRYLLPTASVPDLLPRASATPEFSCSRTGITREKNNLEVSKSYLFCTCETFVPNLIH